MMYKWLNGKHWCIGTRIVGSPFAPPNNGSGVPEWFMQHWHTGEREWVAVNRISEYRLTPEGDSLEEKGPTIGELGKPLVSSSNLAVMFQTLQQVAYVATGMLLSIDERGTVNIRSGRCVKELSDVRG